jgi:hypothetical protein
LEQHGFASTTEPYKELNFIMDNCGGQNKNRHVLRLLHFIVKRRIAKVARAIFLVRGHTKNACDRLFNAMKRQYRKTNSYTPDDLLDAIKGNDNVLPFMVPDGTFKDWDLLENELIRKPPPGNTSSNHIFCVDINIDNGNTMIIHDNHGGEEEKRIKMVKTPYCTSDAAFWIQRQPTIIPPVGLQDIKWNEMHKKWGAYVPQEKKQQWKYYKEAPPKDKMAEVSKHSKKARQQRQERTRTIHEKESKKLKQDAIDNKQPDGPEVRGIL